eukprot:6469927-Heterocapsa_arctica.AAC.1
MAQRGGLALRRIAGSRALGRPGARLGSAEWLALRRLYPWGGASSFRQFVSGGCCSSNDGPRLR